MNKGERTKKEILRQSIIYSCQYGLAELTIGTISKLCNLSRTGVISHFDNKEDMQIAVLEYGEQLFINKVFLPARCEDPLEHVKNLLDLWADWVQQMFQEQKLSCPFIKAVVEFQNRPDSRVRSYIIDQQNRLIGYLKHRIQRCIEKQKLPQNADSEAIAYELYSLYIGHTITQHTSQVTGSHQLFRSSVSNLLERYQAA